MSPKEIIVPISPFTIKLKDFLRKLLTFHKNYIKLITRVSVSMFALNPKVRTVNGKEEYT